MITVDESRPYRRLTEEEWSSITPSMFPIEDLVLSQKHGTTISLIAVQVFGDDYPPVKLVRYGNKIHVHDGHHRVLSEYIKGHKKVYALLGE
jgi:hypothetical protein